MTSPADSGENTLRSAIDQANATMPDYARVGGWITASPFTLRNGQATGNGRPVRTAILSHYAAPLAALYSSKEPAHVVL